MRQAKTSTKHQVKQDGLRGNGRRLVARARTAALAERRGARLEARGVPAASKPIDEPIDRAAIRIADYRLR
tara:strand:+ start:400 stop:612 length:213 start_codon:yes stop_codon:yes gene_type:complete